MKWYWWVLIAAGVIIIILVLLKVLSNTLLKTFGVDLGKIQEQQSMSAEQLLELPDDELIMAVTLRLEARYNDAALEIAQLNDTERTMYAVAMLDLEVQNGGLCQFFTNSSGYTAPYLADALKRLGAEQTEHIYTDFIDKYDIDVTSFSQLESDSFEEYDRLLKMYPFDEFDNAFVLNYQDENLGTLNAAFIREHIEEFSIF